MTYLTKLFLLFLIPTTVLTTNVKTAIAQDNLAYKLAVLHTKAEEPEKVLLNKPIEPSRAILSEFEWILQSLHNRCLDPETTIANTIIETWYITKKRGSKLSLLEVARALSQMTQNTNLFGRDKVSFRLTSKYWLTKHFRPIKK